MIKTTLNDLKNSEIALKKVLDSVMLPVEARIKLASIVDTVDYALEQIERVRVRLILKYGKKAKDGKKFIPPEKMLEFDTETESMLNKELEIPDCNITLNELIEFDNLCTGKYIHNRLTARDISNIKFLFNVQEKSDDSIKNEQLN